MKNDLGLTLSEMSLPNIGFSAQKNTQYGLLNTVQNQTDNQKSFLFSLYPMNRSLISLLATLTSVFLLQVSLPGVAYGRQEMTLVTCWHPQPRMLASAFMLPPGWQATCDSQLKQNVSGVVFSSSIFKATHPKSGIQLLSLPSELFKSDDVMVQIPLQAMQHEKMMYGFVDPQTKSWYSQTLANNPKPVDLTKFAKTQIATMARQGGYSVTRVINDPIADQLRGRIKKMMGGELQGLTVNVVAVTTRSNKNPDSQGLLKIIQTIHQSGPVTQWSLDFFGGEGKKGNLDQVSKLIDLVISTGQPAPAFETALARLNIQLSKQRMQALKSAAEIANITSNALSSVNDQMMSAYKSRSAGTDRIHSKMIDATLEVEKYINPFDGNEVKMPSSNTYYFTNNFDDYIGSNNPLFNPNDSIDSLYNWRKLDKPPSR